jgi:hypothetical protein
VTVTLSAQGLIPENRSEWGTFAQYAALFDALENGDWEDIEIFVDYESVLAPSAFGDISGRQARLMVYGGELAGSLGRRRARTRSCTFSGHWIETHTVLVNIIARMTEMRKTDPAVGTTALTFRMPDQGPWRRRMDWQYMVEGFKQVGEILALSGDMAHELHIDDQSVDGCGCLLLTPGLVTILEKRKLHILTYEVAATERLHAVAIDRPRTTSLSTTLWSALAHGNGPSHILLGREPCMVGNRVEFLRKMSDAQTESLSAVDWEGFDAEEGLAFWNMLDSKGSLNALNLTGSLTGSLTSMFDDPLSLFPNTPEFAAQLLERPKGASTMNLKSLALAHWWLQDAPLEYLGNWMSEGRFDRLEFLHLDALQFEESGFASLVRGMAQPQGPPLANLTLQNIYLQHEDSVDALLELLGRPDKCLRKLFISNCEISLGDRDRILRAALDCPNMSDLCILDRNGALSTEHANLIAQAYTQSSTLLSVVVRDQDADPVADALELLATHPNIAVEQDVNTHISFTTPS